MSKAEEKICEIYNVECDLAGEICVFCKKGLDGSKEDIEEDENKYCGDCGKELTEDNRWSDFTCQECCDLIGLDCD